MLQRRTPARRAGGGDAVNGTLRSRCTRGSATRDKDQDPELQLDALRAYVVARGWVAIEYVDQAAAGDLAHRTAWARLLADVAQRKVDLVMVWKLDRAFRSTLHALATSAGLRACRRGLRLAHPARTRYDISATGRLVFTILAAVAEMERELIADRVKEGMRHAARQGKRIGRPPVTARPPSRAAGRGPRRACRREPLPPAGRPPLGDRHGDARPALGGGCHRGCGTYT